MRFIAAFQTFVLVWPVVSVVLDVAEIICVVPLGNCTVKRTPSRVVSVMAVNVTAEPTPAMLGDA